MCDKIAAQKGNAEIPRQPNVELSELNPLRFHSFELRVELAAKNKRDKHALAYKYLVLTVVDGSLVVVLM